MVIWRLSSMPFTGTVLAPLKSHVYILRVKWDNGIWSRFMISSFGILCSTTKLEIFFWNVSFPSSRYCFEEFTFPVVPFRFDYSKKFKTPRANHQWVAMSDFHFPSTLLHYWPLQHFFQLLSTAWNHCTSCSSSYHYILSFLSQIVI